MATRASIAVIEVLGGNSLLTPAFGPVGGGTTMYILGANLEDASAVDFGGNDLAQPWHARHEQFDSRERNPGCQPGRWRRKRSRVRVVTPDGLRAHRLRRLER